MPTGTEVVYDVPDFFDGTLKIMAVAVADDAAGSAEREAIIRGPFVITPSVPVLVAPGDEFEAGVTVANNLDSETEIDLRAERVEPIYRQLVAVHASNCALPRAANKPPFLEFRVNDELGAGEIKFSARGNNEESTTTRHRQHPPPGSIYDRCAQREFQWRMH